MSDRFERNIGFFGKEGQNRLLAQRVCVVGAGGVGGHVLQQLAFLGVGAIDVIDPEELDVTNRNRYVPSENSDPIPGTLKVDIADRLITRIDPAIKVSKIPYSLRTRQAFEAVIASDFVFGCVDTDGIRLLLLMLCAANEKPLMDISSDTEKQDELRYGGRVSFFSKSRGCLLCLRQIDASEAGLELEAPAAANERAAIYGVERAELAEKGPSVVSINGVVASLGVTEYMVETTGLRPAVRLMFYRAHLGKVLVSLDEPAQSCAICDGIRGKRAAADIERYIQPPQ